MSALLHRLGSHEARARRSLNFTPSENMLSPLARVPLVTDSYSRYFFNHQELFGEWMFFGGLEAGLIEPEILRPLLQEMTGARYVDVRPISGLNCMTIAMAGLCPSGGTMFTVPESGGGHMSTTYVAARLGITTVPLPMRDTHGLDLEALERDLARHRPDLIYLDQSTQLFPIDPRPVRALIDATSPETVLHVDSSHTNGLILTGAMTNPLTAGAHTFGGSTHKTLPGPHKGFLATNDERLRDRIDAIAYHYVSHHHLGAVISLAITLLELRDCGGEVYGASILENARRFAEHLSAQGIPVAAPDQGFTRCHQVWAQTVDGVDAGSVAQRMHDSGILVNRLGGLPGLEGPAFRLSLAEMTRLGATGDDMKELASLFASFLSGDPVPDHHDRVQDLRKRLLGPAYCYGYEDLVEMGAPPGLLDLFSAVSRSVTHEGEPLR
ncbi:hypothetical protein V1J52_25385 [Streptomyces sp. TRM 70351]|uniref:hypothetical protein n=1 Tax=Streptomyces sp. TRM 70351 TaxID=3116552 RepID=UPI002E7C2300|nr:hypothetical protein [Streptomyces sp. TRM 70351]MEE1931457.1 hypothetical protein [Streptomyces sp. TRM 70351]